MCLLKVCNLVLFWLKLPALGVGCIAHLKITSRRKCFMSVISSSGPLIILTFVADEDDLVVRSNGEIPLDYAASLGAFVFDDLFEGTIYYNWAINVLKHFKALLSSQMERKVVCFFMKPQPLCKHMLYL